MPAGLSQMPKADWGFQGVKESFQTFFKDSQEPRKKCVFQKNCTQCSSLDRREGGVHGINKSCYYQEEYIPECAKVKKKKNWQSSCWREANAKILHVLHSPQEPGTRASGADGVEEG